MDLTSTPGIDPSRERQLELIREVAARIRTKNHLKAKILLREHGWDVDRAVAHYQKAVREAMIRSGGGLH